MVKDDGTVLSDRSEERSTSSDPEWKASILSDPEGAGPTSADPKAAPSVPSDPWSDAFASPDYNEANPRRPTPGWEFLLARPQGHDFRLAQSQGGVPRITWPLMGDFCLTPWKSCK